MDLADAYAFRLINQPGERRFGRIGIYGKKLYLKVFGCRWQRTVQKWLYQ